jgi:putative membrane protein
MAFLAPLANLALLHGDLSKLSGPYWTDWHFEPSVVVGTFGLAAAYLAWTGPLNRRRPGAASRPVTSGQRVAFLLGCLILFVALGQPLDHWSDGLLVSAHMVQHLLLTLLVPPLWLFGTPAWVLRPLLRWRAVAWLGYTLTRPFVAFVLSSLAITIWHVPALYDASVRNLPLHILQHQVFLGTALLAWWPLLGPLPEWPKLSPPLQCLYLFLQTLPGGVVGSIITLAAPGLYAAYDGAPRMWGISPATDQQVAGLLMWIFTSTVYLLLVTVIFFRWAAREERAEVGVTGGTRPAPIGR